MKIGVSSYSFHKLVVSGVIEQIDVVAKAKALGFDTMEFAALVLPEGANLVEYAQRIRQECDRVGMKVVNYAISGDFLGGSGGNLEAEVERLKGEVRVAKILGAQFMRHDVTYGIPEGYEGPKGFDDVLPILVKGARAVTEYAAELGIKTMVENHGFFCQDSERVEKLINGVNHPNFGALVDVGNFICADEDPGKAVGRLIPYAFHAHIKDFNLKPGTSPNPGQGWYVTRGGNYFKGSIIGHGDIPVLQCLNAIKKAGYNGMMCIEFEGLEDPDLGVSIGLENLRNYIDEVYK